MNPFTILPVGCWSGGFNFYHTLLGTTLPILIVCATLFTLCQIRREVRAHEAVLLPTHSASVILDTTYPLSLVRNSLWALQHGGAFFTTAAIAILYLTLPTISTTVFKVFPCDDFDDERSMLRADYSISCLDSYRGFWVFYGWLMVFIFPVGVPLLYFRLLWTKRVDLKSDERADDESLWSIKFLWEVRSRRDEKTEVVLICLR